MRATTLCSVANIALIVLVWALPPTLAYWMESPLWVTGLLVVLGLFVAGFVVEKLLSSFVNRLVMYCFKG